MESRILAEDPTRNFLPSAGRLKTYRPPADGERRVALTLRIDSGVREGGEVSIHYDSLIAKLVTHAPDRTAAIDAQAQALDSFVIEGVANNISFLAAMMGHKRFRAGRALDGLYRGGISARLRAACSARRDRRSCSPVSRPQPIM